MASQDLLNDRYAIERELSKSSDKIVFLAIDTMDDDQKFLLVFFLIKKFFK